MRGAPHAERIKDSEPVRGRDQPFAAMKIERPKPVR